MFSLKNTKKNLGTSKTPFLSTKGTLTSQKTKIQTKSKQNIYDSDQNFMT